MPIAMATARSSAVPISSRYDILPSCQLLRGVAEHLVLAGIAGHRPEEVAVQPCDELRERRAPPVGQPRFPDVLGRRLRRVEAQRLPPIELEDESEEAMPERFGVAAGACQLLSIAEMRGGIRDHSSPGAGFGASRPRRRAHDAPHDVPDVHQQRDESDDEESQADVEADRMLRSEPVEPLAQVMPLAHEPAHYAPALAQM